MAPTTAADQSRKVKSRSKILSGHGHVVAGNESTPARIGIEDDGQMNGIKFFPIRLSVLYLSLSRETAASGFRWTDEFYSHTFESNVKYR